VGKAALLVEVEDALEVLLFAGAVLEVFDEVIDEEALLRVDEAALLRDDAALDASEDALDNTLDNAEDASEVIEERAPLPVVDAPSMEDKTEDPNSDAELSADDKSLAP